MENYVKKFMDMFGLNICPEVQEIDIGCAGPLSKEVRQDLLNHCKSGSKRIKAYFKVIKNLDESYLFESALAYHDNGKDRVIYINQNLQASHIHGKSIANMAPLQELSWTEEAETYKELAAKLETKVLSDNPEHSENGYEHAFVSLQNLLGMHARPAAMFVAEATKYDSNIYVRNGTDAPLADIEICGKKYIDGKSIISLMTLGAPKGSQLEIIAQGTDSKMAIAALTKLVNSKFGED